MESERAIVLFSPMTAPAGRNMSDKHETRNTPCSAFFFAAGLTISTCPVSSRYKVTVASLEHATSREQNNVLLHFVIMGNKRKRAIINVLGRLGFKEAADDVPLCNGLQYNTVPFKREKRNLRRVGFFWGGGGGGGGEEFVVCNLARSGI